MSIKGLSDARRLPRLGHVRLGIKSTTASGTEYPKATDYFVVEPPVAKVYGDKPTSLSIMFPIEGFPEQWLKCYSKSRGLICKGDGTIANALVDMDTGEIATTNSPHTELRETACNPSQCPMYEKKQCRELMSLQFLLPDVPGFGIWQLDTSSVNSIINVNSTLALVLSLLNHTHMVPMDLVLEPLEVSPDGKKKTVHVLNLRLNKSISQIRLQPVPSTKLTTYPVPEEAAPQELYTPDNIADVEEDKATVEETKEKPPKKRKKAGEPPDEAPAVLVLEPDKPEDLPGAPDEKRFKTDKQGMIKLLHTRAGEISPDYHETIVKPWMKKRFKASTSNDCTAEQLKETLDWINRPTDPESRNAFTTKLKSYGITSKADIKVALEDVTGKEEGWNVGDLDKTEFAMRPKEASEPKAENIDDWMNENES